MALDRRAWVAMSVGATVGLALVYSSCLLPSDGPDATPSADSAGAADAPSDSVAIDTAMGGDAGAESMPDGSDGSASKPDAYWIDGEYCPDPGWPPRSDGCPCEVSRTPLCRPDQEGKSCDYFAGCPPFGRRVTCDWIRPHDKAPYLGWTNVTAILCEDAGSGG